MEGLLPSRSTQGKAACSLLLTWSYLCKYLAVISWVVMGWRGVRSSCEIEIEMHRTEKIKERESFSGSTLVQNSSTCNEM